MLPHVDAVRVPGAHALNYSDPQLIAELIEAHIAGEPLVTQTGRDLSPLPSALMAASYLPRPKYAAFDRTFVATGCAGSRV